MALKIVGSSPIIHPIKNPFRFAEGIFYGVTLGLEESGPTEGRVKKCPVDTFLARGRVPGDPAAARRAVDGSP